MESRQLALSLLSLVVVASGCAHGPGGGNEPDRAIAVNSFSVTPKEVFEGTSTTVAVDVENTGNLPADINLGPGNKGTRVLKNFCPDIFSIKDFSAVTSGDRSQGSVRLEPGDRLNLRWQLRQQGDVPLYGYRCDIELEMPFNYSVQAYRQVQVKKDRQVEGSPKLYWESSSGPMRFAIETTGSTQRRASSFIANTGSENRDVTVLLQLDNRRREDYSKGVIDVNERTLAIKATEPLQLDEGFTRIERDIEDAVSSDTSDGFERPSGTARPTGHRDEGDSLTGAVHGSGGHHGGGESSGSGPEWRAFGYSEERCDVQSTDALRMFEGESRIISCSVPLPDRNELEAPSEISEIFAQVNYTYLRDIGSRRIEVKPRGG